MFETLPQHPQHPQPFQLFTQNPHFRTPWMPASPSPLGSCNANIPRAAVFSSKMSGSSNQPQPQQQQQEATGKENNRENTQNGSAGNIFSSNNIASSPRQSTYEQRFKSSSRPFGRIFGSSSSTSDDSTTTNTSSLRASKHRALFLNKVKQDRDASRFNARGESIMMMEHLSEQKDWREHMQRKANAIYQQYHMEDGEMSDDDNNSHFDSEQYALELQEQELDALLENMPMENNVGDTTSPVKSVRSFCGYEENDDELEGLFDQIVCEDMDMS